MATQTLRLISRTSAAPRTCPKCGSDEGPWYASQHPTCSWCVPCFREASRVRAAALRLQPIGEAAPTWLARIHAKDPEDRTRREHLALLRAACPPHRKVCGWCWDTRGLEEFKRVEASSDGRDYYCRTCRQILKRLREYARGGQGHY